MRKITILVVGYLCYTFGATAQSGPKVPEKISLQSLPEKKALLVGDKVPPITFENVLNYKSKKASLSDFNGKLVILDMWSVWCTACIAAFPKMEELQAEFKDKIQILLVNPHSIKYDSEEKIKSTLYRNKSRTGFYPTLPIPIHDSILNTYFPHQSVPHQIWIDKNGEVVAITGSEEVTSENIRSILDGRKVHIPVKDDWAFNRRMPLLVDGNGGEPDDFVYRSLFTGYKDGIGFASGVRTNQQKEVVGLFILNKMLSYFVGEAYPDIMNGISNNRIILEVKDPAQFNWEFTPAYSYCYDLTIPPIKWDEFNTKIYRKYLQEDLRRVFNLKVSREKRSIKCMVLTANDKLICSYSKYQKSEQNLDNDRIKKFIHNYSVAEAIRLLDRFSFPLVDETATSWPVDIDFPDNSNLSDWDTVMQVLKNVGLNMKEEVRDLEVVVISDK